MLSPPDGGIPLCGEAFDQICAFADQRWASFALNLAFWVRGRDDSANEREERVFGNEFNSDSNLLCNSLNSEDYLFFHTLFICGSAAIGRVFAPQAEARPIINNSANLP
jgi:hypothetical protein